MNVFLTGHKGFIGSHLVELLKEEGHHVTGCDLNLFEGCNWEPLVNPDREMIKDIRDLAERDIDGNDVIMHLAAISNDPMGELDENLTYSINQHASVHLAKIAKKAGVPRYLYASSCSAYGKGVKLDLDESAPLRPVSAYAVSKVNTEREVSALADDGFCPVFLRNATAYGYSRNLRIDLVANNLLACAYARGDIRIKSDGEPWRPLTHCRDIARAFIAFAQAPRERIHNRAVNIGANSENYQVKDIAAKVQQLLPEATIVFTGETGEDPRNYRVAFDLLYRLLPEFKLQYTLESGLGELYRKFVEHHFGESDFDSDQFVRLKTLKKRMNLIAREGE